MNHTKNFQIVTVLFSIILCCVSAVMAAPVGTAFTYQGRLIDANEAADGLYDFQFKLFDASSDSNQTGGDVNSPDVDVIDGYFTVELDFGSVFDGNALWLDIGVRPGDLDDPNVYTALIPRQSITPAPYAAYASGGGSGESIWQINGSNIYYNTGNVGIGTASPSDELDVAGHINASESFKLDGDTILANKGTDSIFAGKDAGENATTCYSDTVVGAYSLYSNTSGSYNSALGSYSLYSNTTGHDNTAIGDSTLYYNTTGLQNTAVGSCSMIENNTGSGNSVLGYSTLTCNTTGNWNSAVGYYTLVDNITGTGNSAVGGQALCSNTEGNYNTAFGATAGFSNSTGSGNVFLGYNAGHNNSTGNGNVFLGTSAGYNETGSGKLYIANSSGTPLIYGDFSTGMIGLGTTSPAAKLDVAGQVKISGGSPGTGKVLTSDAAGLATWQTPVIGDTDWTISGNDMYSGVSGNVGIGTASPGRKLDVAGGINAVDYYYLNGKTLAYNVSGTGDIYYGWDVAVTKHIMATGGTERLVINNAGNVGIGTTSPSTKLDVAGQIKISGGSPGTGKVLTSDAGGLASWQNPAGDNLGNHIATQNIRLNDSWLSGDGDKEGISVAGNGNVGIGTMSPAAKLDVTGNINIASVYKIDGNTVLSAPGAYNTFLGVEAGQSNTGSFNTFSGNGAGNANTTGSWNTFAGYSAGNDNITGSYNTFFGNGSGWHSTGYHNTFSGYQAGMSKTTGNYNTFTGSMAGERNTTGAKNTFFGSKAGYNNLTGSGNVFIGHEAGYDQTGSDKLYIANSSVDANVLIYGDFSTRRLGIGTMSPAGRLEVSHDGSSHDFIVDANGDAAIGTAPSSSQKLWVSTSSNVTAGNFVNWGTSGYSYGIRGLAQGESGTNHIGVYGYANFANNNWAGYFEGNVHASGNVGIGTTTPARNLHISDVMRLQPRATVPSSPAEGDIYMNSTTHKLMVYTGTAWEACN